MTIIKLPSRKVAQKKVATARRNLNRQLELFARISDIEEDFSERGRKVWEETRHATQIELGVAMATYADAVKELDLIVDFEVEPESSSGA